MYKNYISSDASIFGKEPDDVDDVSFIDGLSGVSKNITTITIIITTINNKIVI